MNKEQVRLMKFALDYPGWHSIAKRSADPKANRALDRLSWAGLVEIVKHGPGNRQFRARPPKFMAEG